MTTFTTSDRIHAEKDGSYTIDCTIKPLPADEIERIANLCWGEQFDYLAFARALEKAHGIV